MNGPVPIKRACARKAEADVVVLVVRVVVVPVGRSEVVVVVVVRTTAKAAIGTIAIFPAALY